ncbi:MAG: extracellular solute-binding protein [Clostridiales bacterium]|jgi:ABC-type glycerol-3-phosphate transport system substrate-binding protein|nr:extracellular solute-binding protein [Clostridiales bacterium]
MVKWTKRRAAAILLAVSMLIAVLSACGVKVSENGSEKTDDTHVTAEGTVFVPNYYSLPEDITSMSNACFYDDMLYFTSYGMIGAETVAADDVDTEADAEADVEDVISREIYGPILCQIRTDGTGYKKLEGYLPVEIPDDRQGNMNISAFCVDKEGSLYVIETGGFYHVDEYGNYIDDGQTVYLRKLDEAGAELLRLDLTEILSDLESVYIRSIATDGEGRIYLTDGDQKVTVLSKEGDKLVDLSVMNWIDNLITLKDGRVAAMAYEGGRVVKIVDPVAKSWGESISLPMYADMAYSGSGDYDLYYSDSSYLIGYSMETKESTKLINWINCDINSDNITGLSVLPDGRILCVLRSSNYTGEMYEQSLELALIIEKPASEVPQKTVLTMATLYTDYNIRAAIIDFNKKNDKYRIEVKDYSEYNTEDDYDAGLLKLNTEIITGNAPDLLSVSTMLPMRQYTAKGLLEDLYPYIDTDTELGGRDALMQGFFKALETDGKLYQISPTFGLSAIVGSAQVVGTEMGWTIDELNALLETFPEDTQAFANVTSSRILYDLCAFNMDEYVDWNTGKCSFDSEGFIRLLEFAAGFPREINWESGERESETDLIREGKVLLQTMYLSGFDELQLYQAMFGGDITFKGFPCESGVGNVYTFNTGISMSTKCSDKEGAWAFMRTLLTEEYQKNERWQFPTNRACFDAMVEEAMEKRYRTDENGVETEVPKSTYGFNDLTVEIYASTQEQVDQILNLLDNTDKTMYYDQAMLDIITTETEAFFAGQKSAAETANVIQSRINIYVNEQK